MKARRWLQIIATTAALFLVHGAGFAAQQNAPPPGPRKLVMIDRAGMQTLLGEVPGSTWGPRISPDGGRIVFTLTGATRAQDNMYVAPLNDPSAMKLVGPGRNPYWSADGTRLFFAKEGSEILMWRRIDVDDPGEPLMTPVRAPESLSRDGRLLSYVQSVDNLFSAWTFDVATRTRTPIGDDARETLGANLSPDGRWIAYQSTRTGRHEVWVRPVGRAGPSVQVSTQGGFRPVWSPDMRELFFDDGNRQLFVIPVRTEPGFAVAGAPAALPIRGFVQTGVGRRQYDLAPDGRFVVMLP